MDFKPRKLPVFNRVERKEATTPMIQERSAIYKGTVWMPQKEISLVTKAWDTQVGQQGYLWAKR